MQCVMHEYTRLYVYFHETHIRSGIFLILKILDLEKDTRKGIGKVAKKGKTKSISIYLISFKFKVKFAVQKPKPPKKRAPIEFFRL